MKRGEVYDAALDPTSGSEQAGFRPVIIVSRDSINTASSVVVVVPCTTYREGRNIYPSQVLIEAPRGGLEVTLLALGEQVRAVSKQRLKRRRGSLTVEAMTRLDLALRITLDLGAT